MIEDNTPTVTPRRRKPTERLRIRLETARRLQNLNAKTKTKRAVSKAKRDKQTAKNLENAGSHAYSIAPRIPKIKKNKLSRPAPPDAKYKKRQRCKTWLPTHVFHAKRAHMTSPAEPLWRFAVPLSPTEKSYRPSHRARGARGAVVWDMSYMSTVQIEGTVEGVESVLRGVGVDGDEAWGRKGRKWRAGTRSLQTWVFERNGDDGYNRPTAPVTLVWAAEEKSKEVEMADVDDTKTKKGKKDRRKVFIRVHPSAFLQLWNELLEISKRQNPPVMVEDLRFEIGSIEVTGPGAMEALIAALQPLTTDGTPSTGSPEATWTSLLGVTNPSSLPQNALLAFSISDPRLHFPSQTLRPLSSDEHMQNQAMLLASWPPDQTLSTPKIFDRPSRLAAARQLPSQKAINRRRTLAGPGIRPAGQASDPQIPVMILASPSRPIAPPANRNTTTSNLPGSLTVLLPWKCVLPVWYSLMYYPLSSGGNPRFGGLQEQRQLAFEAGTPWFPGDYPGTRAGWEWGLREREETRREWERKPKGRRIEFDRLDLGTPGRRKRGEIGRGWACDWERLMQGADASPSPPENEHPEHSEHPPLHIHQLRSDEAEAALSRSRNGEEVKADRRSGALATVRIWLKHRGTPTPRARIYRLPSDRELSQRWLEQGQRQPHKAYEAQTLAMTPEDARQSLAAALEQPKEDNNNQENELPIPGEEDLIGFVTTGAYNLAEGKGTGIGSIAVDKVGHAQQESKQKPKQNNQEKQMCIVRGPGERVGRLGHWEVC